MSLLLAHRAICCVACVLLLPCCSDDMVSPSGPGALAGAGGAAGNAGSPSVSGGAAAAGTGSGAVAGASGGGTNTGYVDCSSFKDSTGWSLRVHIENEMSQTLYLGQDTNGCAAPLFQVEDGARRELPMLDGCRTSCEALTQGTAPPCQEACTSPATVTLEPGQSVEVPWDGRFGVEESLPLQCAAAGTAAPLTCVRAERVEAGVFTFSARAGTRRECLEASGNCGCTPAQSGCTTPSSLIGGTIYTRELLMMLEPGEPSPSGEPPYIGLVFQDE